MSESWRQVDVELRRRRDLIPNLVQTVAAYAAHESATLQSVAHARAIAAEDGSSPDAQGRQESVLAHALGRLLAVAEGYPDLKANSNYAHLQHELTDTEDRIAAARRCYNGNVRALNTRVQFFPSNIIAKLFGFRKAEYFDVDELAARSVPTVTPSG